MTIAPRTELPISQPPTGPPEDGSDRRKIVLARWAARLALPALCAVAAVNFLWQLGSSSYYVDEVLSLNASLNPLGSFVHAVSRIEISPPAYFLFLHEWLYRWGSGDQWLRQLAVGHEPLARLPSAVCGVLLVVAVYWLCSLVSDRRATRLGAAALTALSPFVLEYSQLAQPYVFTALAVTVAIAAAVEAEAAPPASQQTRWLALSLIASVLALCLHYTAALVIAPLAVWVALRSSIPRRWRLAVPAACAATALALLPLVLAQHHAFHDRPGVLSSGAVSLTSVANLLEVPFTGRVDELRGLGVVVMVAALVVLLAGAGRTLQSRTANRRQMIAALAAGIPVCLFVLSVVGGKGFLGHVMLARYAAVGAPLMIVALALAVESLPTVPALALAACAAVLAVAGLVQSHRPQAFYLDARDAVHYVQQRVQPGDLVRAPSDPVAQVPLMAYGLSALHPQWTGDQTPSPLFAPGHRRLWLITELPAGTLPSTRALLTFERTELKPFGERALAARVFPGIPGLAAVLLASLGEHASVAAYRQRIPARRLHTIQRT